MITRRRVAADNVVVQHGLELPVIGLCELGQVMTAQKALLFSSYGHEHESRCRLQFYERVGAGKTYCDTRCVVVRTWRLATGVQNVGVAGVVVSGDQIHPLRLRGV